MIVNLDKFQLMLLKKSTNKFIKAKLQININEIESENSVTLLGITIDNRLPYFKTIQQSTHATKCYIVTEEIQEPKRVGSCS